MVGEIYQWQQTTLPFRHLTGIANVCCQKQRYLWPDIHSLLNCAGILSAYNYA